MSASSTASETTRVGDLEDDLSLDSDDSSFYGDRVLRQEYKNRVLDEDTDHYSRVHNWNLQVIAARAVEKDPEKWVRSKQKRKRDHQELQDEDETATKKNKAESEGSQSQGLPLRALPSKPYNPYEGKAAALQLSDDVNDFLKRLKPSRADTTEHWIWCANFQAERRPLDENIPVYKQAGLKLLEHFLSQRQKLESSFDPPKNPGVITRMMGSDRKNLEEDIIRAAKKNGVICGKWMLFPTEHKVDKYWAAIVHGTVEGHLGIAAKVATRPDKPEEPTQVICIYTKDFSDEVDVKRVLLELVRLKLAPAIPGPLQKGAGVKGQIWYKPDCYTYLDIMSNNEYKLKPTLYGTSTLLTSADVRSLS